MTPLLVAEGIVKRFGGATALNGVSFDLHAGEVHAVCGENGAGKSTLIKLLAGVHPHGTYEGRLQLDGHDVTFRSTRDAERAGIAIVHQELALFPELSVAENLFLTGLPRRAGRVDWPELHVRARALLQDVQLDIDPRHTVGHLGIAQQQLVEIARALGRSPRILVLDEPTAALARHEVDHLLDIVRRLRGKGVACIYISHKLDEVFAVADRITVLRDGEVRGTRLATGTTADEIVALMVGRPLGELYPARTARRGETRLSVSHLEVRYERHTSPVLSDISFDVASGEVLGIGGLMGAGRSELLLHLVGRFGTRTAGSVMVSGREAAIHGPRDALRAGMALVTEDRKRLGLVLDLGVAFNLTLSALPSMRHGAFVDRERELSVVRDLGASLQLKARSADDAVTTLSGGNQQKVVIGKALLTRPSVLLLDEPTRGIDIGARQEIYQLMNRLAAEGTAIVMVSSELNELLGMSDRIVMLHEGRIGGVFERADATEERLLAAAMGRLNHAA